MFSPLHMFRGLATAMLVSLSLAPEQAHGQQAKALLDTPSNRLVGIHMRDTELGRTLRFALEREPIYTAFRLTSPSRLVIDIQHGDTSALHGQFPLKDGVIGSLAVYQYTGDHAPVGRIVVGLPQDETYALRVDGQTLVVDLQHANLAQDVAQSEPMASPMATAAASLEPSVDNRVDNPSASAPPAASPSAAPSRPDAQLTPEVSEKSAPKTAQILGMKRQGNQIFVRTRGTPTIETELLSNPPRFVVDIAAASGQRGALRLTQRPGWVKQVRVGRHGSAIRLVFDLAPHQSAVAKTQSNGFVVRPAPLPGKTAQAQTSEDFAAISARRVAGFRAEGPLASDMEAERSEIIDASPSSSDPGKTPEAPGALPAQPSARQPEPAADEQTTQLDVPPTAAAPGLDKIAIRRAMGRPAAADLVPQPQEAASGAKSAALPTGTALPPAARSRSQTQEIASALHRRRISLDVKDADIINVLRLISEETGENIIASDEVHGKVTLKLRNVPADQALDTMLRTKGFDRVRHNNIIRIASAEAIQKERDNELARRRSLVEVEDTIIKMVTVNYATASEVVAQLRGMLSPRGTVQVDARTNTLVLQDIVSNIDRLVELAQRLDKQTPLVNIQARIVEASSDHVRDLGIQWGGTSQQTARTGNPTGVYFPHDMVVNGAADAGTTNQAQGLVTPSRYAVNLPANLGGAGGGLGFILGAAGGSQLLDLRLTAAETNGTAKIISSPEVSTLDNRMARVSQGTEIPISTVSAAGTMTRFIPAVLALEVTPHVTNDGTVLLKINVQKSQPDFSNRGAAGDPTIQKKQAETEVLVRDGDTSVIGGIYTRTTSDSANEVPFLARIPLLGLLFREKRVADNRSELLVFITPRIINRDESLVQSGPILEGTKG